MSDRNGKSRIHTPGYCTHDAAEQLAHAAYLLGRKEEAVERHKMALAFEERIKGIEAQLAALSQNAPIAH